MIKPPSNPLRRQGNAPIVPTSNMRLRRPQPDEDLQKLNQQQQSTGQQLPGNFGASGMASGAPRLSGNSGAPPVTGPGVQHPPGGVANGGNTGLTGTSNQQLDHTNAKTTDDLANDAITQLLQDGPRNTSDDESLINQMLQSTVGQGQADLNARMGAGGFGTSGALGALSGDMRVNAAQKAAGDVMNVRQSARDEWLDKVTKGLDAEFKDRGMDMSEEQYDSYLNAILAANGISTGGPGQANSAPGPSNTGSNTIYDGLSDEEAAALHQHLEEQATQGRADSIGGSRAMDNAQEVSSPPNGGQLVSSDGTYNYYVVHNYNDTTGNPNTYYKVRTG